MTDSPDSSGHPDKPENPDDKKPEGIRGMVSGRLRDAFGLAKHTAGDLKKPKEIGLLLTAVVVPGGFVGYAAYRLREYRNRKPVANDNTTPPLLKGPENADKPASPDKKPKQPKNP